MSYDPESTLAKAMERVTLLQVSAALGLPLRGGLQSSPFRGDSHDSFSVFADNKRFKDHGREGVEGGAWRFVELARPEWSKREIARFLIALAGLDPDADAARARAGYKRLLGERRRAMYRDRQRALVETRNYPPLPPWPDFVRDRYDEGRGWLAGSEERVAILAGSRGWAVDVVEALVNEGKVSMPALPWSDVHRGVAFAVEAPHPVAGVGARALSLVPVGYHQRYIRDDRKNWTFVPYVGNGEGRTDFQRALGAAGRRVYPLPFVLGEVARPRLVVITEGQWDCITFFAACGWFNDAAFPGGVAAFGMRGTQSVDVFLAVYGPWLKANSPSVLLIPDNDAAGRRWAEPEREPMKLPNPSFVDRLRAWGAGRVVVAYPPAEAGKDFNDWFRVQRPDPDFMLRWLSNLGLGE